MYALLPKYSLLIQRHIVEKGPINKWIYLGWFFLTFGRIPLVDEFRSQSWNGQMSTTLKPEANGHPKLYFGGKLSQLDLHNGIYT